jgi:uncharacterized protein YbjT (DUF2867 family)
VDIECEPPTSEIRTTDVVRLCTVAATTSVFMTTTAESPILVLGATGGQGGAVTAALLARQARVRAMVRRPGEPSVQRLTECGVEVMVGSLDDRAALGAAMEGAAAVFALTTPFEAGVDAEVAQGRAIVAAAGDARVPHLVFSSVAGADQHTGVPHFDSKAIIEKDWAASGLPYTITAPTYFFDNALGGEGADRIAAGIIDLPLPRGCDESLTKTMSPTTAVNPLRAAENPLSLHQHAMSCHRPFPAGMQRCSVGPDTAR